MKCPICRQEMQPIRAYATSGFKCKNGTCGVSEVGFTTLDIEKINAALARTRAEGFEEAIEAAAKLADEYPFYFAPTHHTILANAIRELRPAAAEQEAEKGQLS